MDKIKMTTPLVEMDGDEMTRILWKMIKDELLLPFIDLKTEYYDLGLEYRDETNDSEIERLRRELGMREANMGGASGRRRALAPRAKNLRTRIYR